MKRVKEISKAVVNKVLKKDEEKAQERLDVCNTCIFNISGICSECGCIISLKVYSPDNSCPKHKWKK